jgi:hypothetical protein
MDKVKALSSENNGNEVFMHAMVESSTVRFVYWSNISNIKGTLTVTFVNGKRYRYDSVGAHIFTQLITADSIGKKFNELVRGKYDYALVS